MRIIIFGCGDIYQKRKNEIPDNVEVVGIIDNNKNLYGKTIDGITVFSPLEAKRTDCDYIVLMSNAAVEMREQLIRLGYGNEKLIHYADFFGSFPQKLQKYNGVVKGINIDENIEKKTLLIVSVFLAFSGVPMIALRTAKTAAALGYCVTIAADGGDSAYISEAVGSGIDVIICKELKNASLENLLWTDPYDYVLINSVPMLCLAVKLSQKREVALWLHESSDVYHSMKFWEKEISEGIQRRTIKLFAVSKRAREHFFQVYGTQRDVLILSLGVEDKRKHCQKPYPGFFYGLAGGIYHGKGQDIFLAALERFPETVRKDAYFFLAGKKIAGEFGMDICRRAFGLNNCILMGERTPQEMLELYGVLDVVVVASRSETLSMVAVEAMMMGKVCIVSDQTGIAEYMEQGKNGFVFCSENVEELKELMLWCYLHRERLKEIGENARRTYEQNFTMEIFIDHLREALQI